MFKVPSSVSVPFSDMHKYQVDVKYHWELTIRKMCTVNLDHL